MAMALKHRARSPAHQGHVLRTPSMQRLHLQAGHEAREPVGRAGVDHHARLIGRVHLLQLDQDCATPLAERAMSRAHRVAQVGAGGMVALLIREGSFRHQDFLAAAMAMTIEPAERGVTHE